MMLKKLIINNIKWIKELVLFDKLQKYEKKALIVGQRLHTTEELEGPNDG